MGTNDLTKRSCHDDDWQQKNVQLISPFYTVVGSQLTYSLLLGRLCNVNICNLLYN